MDGKNEQFKTRFAPTPSGYLHQGNLFSFILTWLIAKKNNGIILLRIDDIDHQRVREHYLADIFDSIEWLGLDYDQGPSGVADFQRNFSQQTRLELYHKAIMNLEALPNFTFYCECSRSEVNRISQDGTYPGTCTSKNLKSKNNHTLRIKTDNNTSVDFEDCIQGNISIDISESMRHFILRKKDGYPSYQLTSVVDDDYFGINNVIRGRDLLNSTAAQLFLAKALNKIHSKNTNYFHHPLLKKESKKLSKSQGDSYIPADDRTLKNREKLIKEFCLWMQYKTPVATLNELSDLFDIAHVKQLRQVGD